MMRDDYYQIDVKWKHGFKHTIYCRGYNLKSWLNFQDSIFWIETVTHKQITEKQYNKGMGLTDGSETTTKESTRGRKESSTNNRVRNNSRGNDKRKGVKPRSSTGSRSRSNNG